MGNIPWLNFKILYRIMFCSSYCSELVIKIFSWLAVSVFGMTLRQNTLLAVGSANGPSFSHLPSGFAILAPSYRLWGQKNGRSSKHWRWCCCEWWWCAADFAPLILIFWKVLAQALLPSSCLDPAQPPPTGLSASTFPVWLCPQAIPYLGCQYATKCIPIYVASVRCGTQDLLVFLWQSPLFKQVFCLAKLNTIF